jgi:hypothetical protein
VTAPGRPAGPSTGPRGGGADGDRGRALGTLTGDAIGDALGMPCQMMSRPEVLDRFGPHGLTGFEPADTDHPLAAGMAAGSVTDDTEQALVLARLLQAGGGRVDAADFVAALLDWEAEMRARGSLDLLGPSTRGALARGAGGGIDRGVRPVRGDQRRGHAQRPVRSTGWWVSAPTAASSPPPTGCRSGSAASVVSTNSAGDAHTGALIAALAAGRP